MRSKFLLTCITLMCCMQINVQAQKTTILKSRMTGACFRIAANSSTMYINDSDVYVYSGYRTGAPKNTGTSIANTWTYSGKNDTLTRRRYDTLSTHNYYYYRDRTQNHYAGTNDNLDTSTLQTYDTTAHTWNNRAKTVYIYDGSNNVTFSAVQGWNSSTAAWHDSLVNWYIYDASNNMLVDTFKNLTNPTSNRLYINHYTSNVLDTAIVETWNTPASSFINNSKTVYFLNATHKSDSSISYTWSTSSSTWTLGNFQSVKHHYIYDGSGNNTIDSQWYWGTGMWNVSAININTYDASNYLVSDTSKQAFGGPLRNYYYYTIGYDASHNQTTCERYTWLTSSSTWRDTALYTNTYNSYNQLTSYTTQTMIGGTWVFTRIGGGGGYSDVKNAFYYSTYNDPTGVPVVNSNDGTLKLYPVPASNMLNIELTWDDAQSAVIAVYDMTGKLYTQWQTGNTNAYTHTFYLSQLPAGNYIMKVRGEKAQAAQPFVIIK